MGPPLHAMYQAAGPLHSCHPAHRYCSSSSMFQVAGSPPVRRLRSSCRRSSAGSRAQRAGSGPVRALSDRSLQAVGERKRGMGAQDGTSGQLNRLNCPERRQHGRTGGSEQSTTSSQHPAPTCRAPATHMTWSEGSSTRSGASWPRSPARGRRKAVTAAPSSQVTPLHLQ